MSYAVIARKKIRMCLRFGHLPVSNAQRRAEQRHPLGWHFCFRCGYRIPTPPPVRTSEPA